MVITKDDWDYRQVEPCGCVGYWVFPNSIDFKKKKVEMELVFYQLCAQHSPHEIKPLGHREEVDVLWWQDIA